MKQIRVFCKEADPERYPDGLARSVHFSLEEDGKSVPLNHGYGLLFARGEIDGRDVIIPKALRDPKIRETGDGRIEILAVRTEEDGSAEENPLILRWVTEDLLCFEEQGACACDLSYDRAGEVLEISDERAAGVMARWNPPEGAELGRFPMAKGFADPFFFRYEGKWYFLSTNDNLNDIGLFIREGDSVEELMSPDCELHEILSADREKGFVQNFWAPEAHVIDGQLCILFAVSGEEFGVCCHIMKLRKGGRPTEPGSFETPVPVRRKDGRRLTLPRYLMTEQDLKEEPALKDRSRENYLGISLDMTFLTDAGRSYMLWSYRDGLGTPFDTGSMIMIAEIDPRRPEVLISEPVIISRPLYGYENVRNTKNNEGPFVYKRDGRIHVNYSGGDARGYLYIINLLTAEEGSDLLDPKSWKKRCTPLCNFTTWPGVYGPGHNSWFRDENGKDWIAFHAVTAIGEKEIAVGIREYPEQL